MTFRLSGVLPIIPTPFRAAGPVDEASLKRIATHACEAGATALVYPGVASEDVYLTAEERRRGLGIVAAAARGRLPVIAGINAATVDEMCALAETSVAAGADGLMAMAIPAMAPDFTAAFEAISSAAGGCPMILQNLGAPRGAGLSGEAMLDLARAVPAIRYVKEEGIPSGPRVSHLVSGCGADLDGVVGGGGARFLLEELDRGAVATMPALELLELHVAILSAYARRRRDLALEIYEQTLPLLTIQAPYRMRLTKFLLRHRGLIDCDDVREPLPEMDGQLRELCLELYERAMRDRAEVAVA